MAVFVFTNGKIIVNGTDLSDHCTKITVTTSKATQDITAMGATNTAYTLGLGDATISADFLQDYAAASVDAVLSALNGSITPFTVEVRPVNAARSSTNPGYVMSSLLPEYTPLDGGVGDVSKITVNFTNGAQTGLTRNTS